MKEEKRRDMREKTWERSTRGTRDEESGEKVELEVLEKTGGVLTVQVKVKEMKGALQENTVTPSVPTKSSKSRILLYIYLNTKVSKCKESEEVKFTRLPDMPHWRRFRRLAQ